MPTPHSTNGNHDHQATATLATDDQHTHLPLLTAPVRSQDGEEPHPLVRQWRILKLLTYSPKGFTVKELVSLSGMSDKTVRRDLIFLRRVGKVLGVYGEISRDVPRSGPRHGFAVRRADASDQACDGHPSVHEHMRTPFAVEEFKAVHRFSDSVGA